MCVNRTARGLILICTWGFASIVSAGDLAKINHPFKPGANINERILLRLGDECASPITLAGDGEQYEFADFAYLRIDRDKVVVQGDLRGLDLPIDRTRPKLMVNGRKASPEMTGGVLTWRK